MSNTNNSPVVDILSDDEIYDDIQITHTARVAPPLYTNPNTHIHTSIREPILIPSDESDINDSYYDNNSFSNPSIYTYNHNHNHNHNNTTAITTTTTTTTTNNNNNNNNSSNNNANYTHNNNNNHNDNDIQFIGETEIPQPVIQETGFALHLPSTRRFIQMPVDQIVHGGGLWRPIVTTFSYPGGVPMNREGHNHYSHDQIRNRTRNARRTRAGLSNRRTRSQDRDEGSLAAIHRFFTRLGGGYGVQTVGLNDDGVSDSIMEELQRRDVLLENQRINSRSKFASKVKKSQESDGKVPIDLKKSFTNSISSVNDSLCALCGVVLAEGIPDNYKEHIDSIRKDDSLNLRKLVLNEKFRSPWQSWKSFTDADLDLSKKVFFGRCGHVYCGRCVNNIVRYKNMPARERKKRNRRKTNLNVLSLSEVDFEEVEFSAPTSCIAPQCNRRFNGRYFFRELYI